jgi:hypothetical protein
LRARGEVEGDEKGVEDEGDGRCGYGGGGEVAGRPEDEATTDLLNLVGLEGRVEMSLVAGLVPEDIEEQASGSCAITGPV